jgi:hypothetical protein
MTTVSISDGKLIIEVQGWDELGAFKSRLEIPLENVRKVRSAADEPASGNSRTRHSHPRRYRTAGTSRQIGKKVFWDVHPARATTIDLKADRYTSLVIEVAKSRSKHSRHRASNCTTERLTNR